MSNKTKTFKHYKGMPYTIGVRCFGKYDKLIRSTESSLTVDRGTLTDYDGLNVSVQPFYMEKIDETDLVLNKAVVDLSNTTLPWKYDFKNKLLTSRFAIMPYDETRTQQLYYKGFDYGEVIGTIEDENSVFNASNYIIVNTPIDFTSAWEGHFTITTPSSLSSEHNFIGCKTDQRGIRLGVYNSKFMFLAGNGTWFNIRNYQGSYTVLPNTQYYLQFGWDGSNYYLKYSLNDTDFIDDVSYSSTNAVSYDTNPFYIGCHEGSANPWNGLINLENCYISNATGTKIWEGKQTNIPKYITDYTLNGSPVISKYQIASGFSQNDYILTPKLFGENPYTFISKIKINSQSYGNIILAGNNSDASPQFYLQKASKTLSVYDTTGSHTGITVIPVDTWYWVKLVWDGENLKWFTAPDNEDNNIVEPNWTLEGSITDNLFKTKQIFKIGNEDTSSSYYMHGSVDLLNTKYFENDVLVWKAAEPVTETLHGCVKAYYGEGDNVTTPPMNASGEYQVFAVNGDERIALYSESYTNNGSIVKRTIQSDNIDENLWYLGNITIDTGEPKIEKGLE